MVVGTQQPRVILRSRTTHVSFVEADEVVPSLNGREIQAGVNVMVEELLVIML